MLLKLQLFHSHADLAPKKEMGRADGYLPAFAMVGLQFIYAGVALFTRAALLKGLSPRVFVVYRQGIATLLIAPIAFVSRRQKSSSVTANQNAYFEGLYLSSSTAASAMTNLIPAVTFVMTAILGMEKVNIRSPKPLAKMLGTVICVGGAISMALLKGPKLLNTQLLPPKSLFSPGGENWLLGCLFLLGSSFFWSLWMVFQVPISESCPDHLYSSTWMCFLATLESATVALLVEKDGFALAVSFFVQAWCISRRGPLFSSMFNPLCTVIVTAFAAIFQHEETYTGSLVGAFAVIVGLYIVLWGKAKDVEEIEQVIVDESSDKTYRTDIEEPLLSDNNDEIGMNPK
ncbi:WAT1-related protein isoform X1 [Gossypium australe]|uniref:WAT1-related protein isoform X1 n=1 Tax=Gossypium australe TaxID=47621 RepID=A0A5B6V4U9_9ROSI|nr:WAT1-related protein isoform X1 [Gossypium australe]